MKLDFEKLVYDVMGIPESNPERKPFFQDCDDDVLKMLDKSIEKGFKSDTSMTWAEFWKLQKKILEAHREALTNG